MEIPKQMVSRWLRSHDLDIHKQFLYAIDVIHSVVNKQADRDDILESIEQTFIDNGLMSDEEFRRESDEC
jgi:hypothetical protein